MHVHISQESVTHSYLEYPEVEVIESLNIKPAGRIKILLSDNLRKISKYSYPCEACPITSDYKLFEGY